MPLHSSKNYYKAEYEDFERKTWDRFINTPCHCYSYWYCWCDDGHEWHGNYYVDHYHYGGYGYNTSPYDCGAYGVCDFCYEYHTSGDRKKLIEEYFTQQEILEVLQTHLEDTNCWCYERVRSHMLRRRVNSLLRPRRCSSVVFIPTEYRNDVLTECVVKILDKRLGNEVKILHDIKVRNEKSSILAKYGLTLEDYTKFRIERPEICSEPVKEVEPTKPKQKFIKVKHSTLKEGSF